MDTILTQNPNHCKFCVNCVCLVVLGQRFKLAHVCSVCFLNPIQLNKKAVRIMFESALYGRIILSLKCISISDAMCWSVNQSIKTSRPPVSPLLSSTALASLKKSRMWLQSLVINRDRPECNRPRVGTEG